MNKSLITVFLLLGAATLVLSQVQQLSQAAAQPLSQAAKDDKDFSDFKVNNGKKYKTTE
jgi:hypothetical protein